LEGEIEEFFPCRRRLQRRFEVITSSFLPKLLCLPFKNNNGICLVEKDEGEHCHNKSPNCKNIEDISPSNTLGHEATANGADHGAENGSKRPDGSSFATLIRCDQVGNHSAT